MINPVTPLCQPARRTKKSAKGLSKARRKQTTLKSYSGDTAKLQSGLLSGSDFAAPYLVPILRWIE